MGYHVIDPDELESDSDRPSDMRYVSEAAGLDHLGLRVYHVAPGEDIPVSGLHYHDRQEEVFYVVEGELHVETPDETFVVGSGEFFVAEPKSPHRAYNDDTAPNDLTVIGMGAPPQNDGHVYDTSP